MGKKVIQKATLHLHELCTVIGERRVEVLVTEGYILCREGVERTRLGDRIYIFTGDRLGE